MEHVRNNPSIAKYTYRIEYLEKTAEQEELRKYQSTPWRLYNTGNPDSVTT